MESPSSHSTRANVILCLKKYSILKAISMVVLFVYHVVSVIFGVKLLKDILSLRAIGMVVSFV